MAKDLTQWTEDELLPALYEKLPTAFPEFGWKENGQDGWIATKSPLGVRAERVTCNRAHGFYVHGEGFTTWLSFVNGGTQPKGADYPKAVRELAQRVGMTVPDRDETPEAREKRETKEKGRDLLELVVKFCQRYLSLDAPEAKTAREYLKGRGIPEDRWEVWEFGLMPKTTAPLVQEVEKSGWKWEEAKAILQSAGLLAESERGLYPFLYGRVVAPWRGPDGTITTLWGRNLTGEDPKYLIPKGAVKSSPYLLNRSPKGGRLLLVEGFFDAITCREHGFNAAALGGASVSSVLPAIKTHRPDGLTLVMDSDTAGKKGTRESLQDLLEAGLSCFVVELPEGDKDPDAFLRSHGSDALKRLVEEAPHAIRWQTMEIMDTHRGEGWTDRGTSAAIHEAVAFAGKLPAVLRPLIAPHLQTELEKELKVSRDEVFKASLALSDQAAQEKFERETKLQIAETTRTVTALLEAGKIAEARATFLEDSTLIRSLEAKASRPAPKVVLDELEGLEDYFKTIRGRKRIGITQNVLRDIDEALMGIRGLNLLAGPPGCGKTSLAVQFGLSAMESDPTAAVLLVSLEQSRHEHLTRNLAYFSGLPWKTVAMGSTINPAQPRPEGIHFDAFDLQKLKKGEEKLKAVASRFLILDEGNCPEPTLESVFHEVQILKAKTGASKVLVIVDYLQLWPIPDLKNLRTDLDRDKWQIGQLKSLKNLLGPEDAVIGISEAAKVKWDEEMTMGAVMGSARGVYSPDVVMILQPYTSADLMGPEVPGDKTTGKKGDKDGERKEEAEAKLRALAIKGRSPLHLRIVKGRDGVTRGTHDLCFLHRTLTFKETTVQIELGEV